MKALILSLISITFLFFSGILSAADKIVITGTPIVVEKQDDVYVPATTLTTDRDYYYFTIGGTQKVCYREAPATLVNVGSGEFRVRLGTESVNLYCYDYNTEYFVVQ